MVLLTAMFMSTCYWPPVPIETPLAHPWSENVTTFADALHLMMPNLPEEKIPSSIPIADRCWCDLSNGFFSPFNTTKWEELSVVRLKDSLEKDMAAEKDESEKRRCEENDAEDGTESAACAEGLRDQPSNSTTAAATPDKGLEGRLTFWDLFRASKRISTPLPLNGSSTDGDSASPSTVASSPNATSAAVADASQSTGRTRSQASKAWLRREYDLREFGFAMVVDFGWPDARS